eukprot:jgi/Astpho2/2587/Aster-04292
MDFDDEIDDLLELEEEITGQAAKRPGEDGSKGSSRKRARCDAWNVDDLEPPDDLPDLAWQGPAACSPTRPEKEFTVTLEDGRRAYCTLRRPRPGRQGAVAAKVQGKTQQLLSRPMAQIIQDINHENLRRAVQQSKTLEGMLDEEQDPLLQQALQESAREAPACAGPPFPSPHSSEGQLWVDKYAPRSFLELLSEEQVNREVVKWVKAWDPCVFGRQPRPSSPQKGPLAVKQAPLLRPEQKLLLLHGAPGVGKTTIAHVVAKHCGYQTVEINASDDRSATALQSRIQDAVQMQSVIGQRKPNLVVIDEVDGVAGGADAQPGEPAALQAVRKGRKGAPLRRPLIAVCNDLHAPALRPLKTVAKVLQFRAPAADRLVTRLRMICGQEGVDIDKPVGEALPMHGERGGCEALQALCLKTECDVRACLNTLQFLARRLRPITTADIHRLQVGQKDVSKGAFAIWQELLVSKVPSGRTAASPAAQLQQRLGMLQDFGDSELVMAGLHENVYRTRYMDTQLRRTAAIADLLGASDRFAAMTHRRGEWALVKYQPACALLLRSLAAGPDRLQLQWPQAGAAAARQHAARQTLLQEWQREVGPQAFQTVAGGAAAKDVLPFLVAALDCQVRPVAPNLFSQQEKAAVGGLVRVLIAYSLTFMLDTVAEAELRQLPPSCAGRAVPVHPAVHRLCLFPVAGLPCKTMSMALRRLVAHDVTLELIRRRELYSVAQRMKAAGIGQAVKVSSKGNWLETLRTKTEKRKMPLSAQQKLQAAHTAAGKAVKRPMLMKDFFRPRID